MLFIVYNNSSLAVCLVTLGNALEAGSGNNRIVLLEVSKLLCSGAAEKLMNEHILRSKLIYNSERLCILGVSTCKAVEYK